MWILYIIIIAFLILLGISKAILNMVFGNRCEGNPNLKYFTVNDFEELEAEPVEFKSNKGQVLRGYLYTNKDVKKYRGLIIFVHGMGGGHLSYTTEINTLAKAGFIVLGYDNTGTCASEGKSLKGFFQSVIDLNNALKYVKENKELKKYAISLVGHSWGAYTVCQVLQYKPEVKAVVAMSGPNNSSDLICELMSKEIKVNCNFLKLFLTIVNLCTFGSRGIKNTTDILKDTKVPVLLLHGEKDKTVSLKNSLISNKKVVENKNIKVILYKDRFHNVYQTKESEEYLNNVFDEITELSKKYKEKELGEKTEPLYKNIDYKKITEEDETVMGTIIEFLNNHIIKKKSYFF